MKTDLATGVRQAMMALIATLLNQGPASYTVFRVLRWLPPLPDSFEGRVFPLSVVGHD